jgi:hypothetical protein
LEGCRDDRDADDADEGEDGRMRARKEARDERMLHRDEQDVIG